MKPNWIPGLILLVSTACLIGCADGDPGNSSVKKNSAGESVPEHAAVEITSENFDSLVVNGERPVLLDFWATWCGPCRELGPVVEQVAKENYGKVVVGKINVDDEPELAQRFRISSIPALVYFKDGKAVHGSVGAQPKAAIEKDIAMHLMD